MISEHCVEPFVIEPVEVIYEADGRKEITPDLSSTKFKASLKECKTILGLDLEPAKHAIVGKCTEAKYDEETKPSMFLHLQPEQIFFHECDVVEDIAVAMVQQY